jgi:hypothetical protein
MYESDLTRFMRQYLEQHPEEIESQRIGRATWWDKNRDTRSMPLGPQNAPKAGGAEYTFKPSNKT